MQIDGMAIAQWHNDSALAGVLGGVALPFEKHRRNSGRAKRKQTVRHQQDTYYLGTYLHKEHDALRRRHPQPTYSTTPILEGIRQPVLGRVRTGLSVSHQYYPQHGMAWHAPAGDDRSTSGPSLNWGGCVYLVPNWYLEWTVVKVSATTLRLGSSPWELGDAQRGPSRSVHTYSHLGRWGGRPEDLTSWFSSIKGR